MAPPPLPASKPRPHPRGIACTRWHVVPLLATYITLAIETEPASQRGVGQTNCCLCLLCCIRAYHMYVVVVGRMSYVCVVFTLNRCFYPTTSVHPESVSILHPEDTNYVVIDCETVKKQSQFIKVKQVKVLAYRVREHSKTSQIIKKSEKKGENENKNENKKENKKRKQSKTNGRCSEECDARRSERKGKAARGTPCVLKRNRYLLHGQNNTKKITPIARTKHEEDNCCFTDNTTRRGGRRYRRKAGEGNTGANKNKKTEEKNRKDDSKSVLLSLSRSPH